MSNDQLSQLQRVEVPITHGTAFFNALTVHAINLRTIQKKQIQKTEEIMQQLGDVLSRVTTPSSLSGQESDLEIWRTILQQFLNANLFNVRGESTADTNEQSGQLRRLLKLQIQFFDAKVVSLSRHASSFYRLESTAAWRRLRLIPTQSQKFRYPESDDLLLNFFLAFMNCIQFQRFVAENQHTLMQAVHQFDSETCIR